MNTVTAPGAATRSKLMQAAARIVSRDGMAAATTAAIAAEAGVAEGTLYRHFDSKDDLLIAAYRQMAVRPNMNTLAIGSKTDTRINRRISWVVVSVEVFIFGSALGPLGDTQTAIASHT